MACPPRCRCFPRMVRCRTRAPPPLVLARRAGRSTTRPAAATANPLLLPRRHPPPALLGQLLSGKSTISNTASLACRTVYGRTSEEELMDRSGGIIVSQLENLRNWSA